MNAPELALPLLIALIGVALTFDFLNGLHDAANSVATVVSTPVLRPHYAVGWAAFFNFIAFLFFGLHVANTVGTGSVEDRGSHARGRPRGRRQGEERLRRDRVGRARQDTRGDRALALARPRAGDDPGAGGL